MIELPTACSGRCSWGGATTVLQAPAARASSSVTCAMLAPRACASSSVPATVSSVGGSTGHHRSMDLTLNPAQRELQAPAAAAKAAEAGREPLPQTG